MDFVVGGRSAATAATLRHVAAALWNPSAAKRIRVHGVYVAITVATASNLAIARTTTRGTPGSTVTPDIDNEGERAAAPPSGFLLDLAAFTVQPTVDASDMERWPLAAAIGSGVMIPFRKPKEIPAGGGLALITPVAVIFQPADITFDVED